MVSGVEAKLGVSGSGAVAGEVSEAADALAESYDLSSASAAWVGECCVIGSDVVCVGCCD